MKQLCHKTAIVFIAIMSSLAAQAQITVGTLSEPEKGAALELKEWDGAGTENSTKGFLFPKVSLTGYNSLAPLYSAPTLEQIQKAKGMVVYNVNENATGIEVGLNRWDGTVWTSLSKQSGVALFDPCPPTGEHVTVKGYYTKGVALNAITNTIVLPLNVTKPGIYSIQVTVYEGNTTTDAGFSFFGSGEFLNTGLHHVTLLGQGRPSKSTADNLNVDNSIKISANGKELSCTFPSIHVSNMLPNYSFNCSNVQVEYPDPTGKSIKKGLALDGSSNKLTIKLDVTSTTPGAEYHIETDTINGIQFTRDGMLNTGVNHIFLEGKGTPLKAGTYTYTITGNNANMSAVCSANINVAYEKLRILIACEDGSNTSSGNSWNLARSDAAIPMMIKAPAIFDLGTNPNAPFHAAAGGITVTGTGNASDLTNINTLNNYDLVIVSYNKIPSSVDALCNYVKNGKTVLFTADNEWGTGIARMDDIINNLSNTSGRHTDDANAAGAATTDFIPGNLAVNGQYMDLTGMKLGRDGSGNFLFRNLPPDWIVLASNSSDPRNNAKLIMHNRYRMFLSGDGGIFSGGVSTNNIYLTDLYHGAIVDANGIPMAATHHKFGTTTDAGKVWNSAFLANLLIWAFEAANE